MALCDQCLGRDPQLDKLLEPRFEEGETCMLCPRVYTKWRPPYINGVRWSWRMPEADQVLRGVVDAAL